MTKFRKVELRNYWSRRKECSRRPARRIYIIIKFYSNKSFNYPQIYNILRNCL